MDKLIKQGLECRTVADVDALEKELERTFGGAKVRMLGDRPTNWSALSSPVDPQSVLFERATNMWDAEIEFRADKVHTDQRKWISPAEAAHALLGVPLEGPPAMDDVARKELARRCQIKVLDSDDSVSRPTIGFRESWHRRCSQREAPPTILSIEGTNKPPDKSLTCTASSARVAQWLAVLRRHGDHQPQAAGAAGRR